MRAFRLVLACLLLFGLATLAPAGKNEKLMKEVSAIGDVINKAMVANDFETLIGLYTDDAISLPNFGPRMDGVEAFRKHHAEMAAAGMKINSFESEPTEVWEAGNLVVEIGTFAISLTPPGMPQGVEDKGKYMTLYERQADGSLKIKVETWNTDMDPMQTMQMGGPGAE